MNEEKFPVMIVPSFQILSQRSNIMSLGYITTYISRYNKLIDGYVVVLSKAPQYKFKFSYNVSKVESKL